MTRTILALFTAITLSVALAASGPTKTPQTPDGSKVFIGCLVPGPSSGSYWLTNAVEKGVKDKKEMSLAVVAAQGAKVNLEAQVTKEVEVTGTVSSGSSDLPMLNATKVKWRADYCG